MPVYQYSCEDCTVDKKIKKADLYDPDKEIGGYHPNGEYLFFKNYKMKDKVKSPKCPKCGGTNTIQSLLGVNLTCYIRGNGIVKDRAGARRDMNRFHLVNQDPYGHMRSSGEVDHMLDQFRDAGRDMGRIKSERAARSRKAKKQADKIKNEIPKDQVEVLLKMEELGGSCRWEDLSGFYDASGLLSKLIPEYVCKSNDVFMLMAAGRAYVDKMLNPE